jgi:hypothetical protein
MANIEFNNIMWSARDNFDSQKLSKIQKNSDNLYNARIENARGILGKKFIYSDFGPTSATTVVEIGGSGNGSITFTAEKNRAIGFGFSAPYIIEDNTTNATTLVKDALPTIGVRLDGGSAINDTTGNGIDGRFPTAESAFAINLWQDRYTGGGTAITNFDGFAVNMYYINTALTSGSHTALFWVRNSAVNATGQAVGAFTIKANTVFPMVMWVEDLGATRAYG